MIGIDDPLIVLVYCLCIASSLLCVGYGILFWNKGQDEITPTDRKWAQEEKKTENGL